MSVTGSTGQQGQQGYAGVIGPRGDLGAIGWVNTNYTNFFPFTNPTGPNGQIGLINVASTNASGSIVLSISTAGQVYQMTGDVSVSSNPVGYFWIFQNISTTIGYKLTISTTVRVVPPGQFVTYYYDSGTGINFL